MSHSNKYLDQYLFAPRSLCKKRFREGFWMPVLEISGRGWVNYFNGDQTKDLYVHCIPNTLMTPDKHVGSKTDFGFLGSYCYFWVGTYCFDFC